MRQRENTSKVIRVDAEVKEALDALRDRHDLRNYSDAIRKLLAGRRR